MIKQIKFLDKRENEILGGLLLENNDILCGCCGCIIPSDEQDDIEIIEIYSNWKNISDTIIDPLSYLF